MQKNIHRLRGKKQVSLAHNLFKYQQYNCLLEIPYVEITVHDVHSLQINFISMYGNHVDDLMIPIGEKYTLQCEGECDVSLEIKSVFRLKGIKQRIFYQFELELNGWDVEFVSDTPTLICASNLEPLPS